MAFPWGGSLTYSQMAQKFGMYIVTIFAPICGVCFHMIVLLFLTCIPPSLLLSPPHHVILTMSLVPLLLLGWPSVIMSFILTPFILLWTKLIAFPVWLELFHKHDLLYTKKLIYKYKEKEDLVRKEIYTSLTNHASNPSGFICFADEAGGVWVESFWGIIQSMNLVVKEDAYVISPSFVSYLPGKEILYRYIWISVHFS